MSRVRNFGVWLVVGAIAIGGAACSGDDGDDEVTESDRGSISFSDAPEGSTDLGLCYAYDIEQMKGILGGEETFKRLPPAAIGAEGEGVTGEACAWERVEPNGDSVNLRIEVRDFGDATDELEERFEDLDLTTPGAEDFPGIGDEAFAAVADDGSLLQVRSGGYLLTLASRSSGSFDPLSTDTLKLLGTAGLDQLP
jgi:hypothetical protein